MKEKVRSNDKETLLPTYPPTNFMYCFETESHHRALTVLELTMWTRLDLNSKRSALPCLHSTFISNCFIVHLPLCWSPTWQM